MSTSFAHAESTWNLEVGSWIEHSIGVLSTTPYDYSLFITKGSSSCKVPSACADEQTRALLGALDYDFKVRTVRSSRRVGSTLGTEYLLSRNSRRVYMRIYTEYGVLRYTIATYYCDILRNHYHYHYHYHTVTNRLLIIIHAECHVLERCTLPRNGMHVTYSHLSTEY